MSAQSGGGADIRAILAGLSEAEQTALAAISGLTDAYLLAWLTTREFAATSAQQPAGGDGMSNAGILQTALTQPAEQAQAMPPSIRRRAMRP